MYTKEVIDKNLSGRRLLVWDSFKCHISPRATQLLRGRNVNMAVVSGVCTKFVQPADGSWIKPFKDRFREFYDEWMENSEKTYTKGGNMRAPPFDLICKWAVDAWASVRRTSSKNHMELAASGFFYVVVRITKPQSLKPVASVRQVWRC